ncbi:hypothetical protein RHGRI_018116 [Rhododendron griersonianum]|uniref:Wall-associated receptor kinase galacturonan-binding domain-containing protein n=1 Tax=Rhododendron griersonianum TaxID=479676 RepID=A0AAV6K0A9_9ERIC|nr:hypothetical protein RHGRI_018116 [Rhododendron griersonianum]
MSSSKRLLSDVYKTHTLFLLLALALFLGNCNAQTSPICDRPSSPCGNIPIRHPFRLKGDPENCGIKKYELECKRNRLVLYLFHSAKYYVHAINYNNYTIRVVDAGLQRGNCSSRPLYSISYDDLYDNFLYGGTYSFNYLEVPIAGRYYPSIPYDIAEALWLTKVKQTFPSRISTVNWSMGLSFTGCPFSVNNAKDEAIAPLGLSIQAMSLATNTAIHCCPSTPFHVRRVEISYKELLKEKYRSSEANVDNLERLGCLVLHEVDVKEMRNHPILNQMKFDVVVYNFPHAGHFYGYTETDEELIQ